MLRNDGKKIVMTEGDFGLSLPITISGTTIDSDDTISFKIKDLNGNEKVSKLFNDIQDNMFEFMLTKEESQSLPNGNYIYQIDWYRADVFMDNIINDKQFVIEKKA